MSAVRDSAGGAQTVGVQFANASGALVTLNADGSIDYDPNGAFVTTATDTFSYTVYRRQRRHGHGDGDADAAAEHGGTVANPNDYTVTPTDQDTVFGAGRNVITGRAGGRGSGR